MGKIKCLVVDDEELARTLMESYIAKLDFLELVGSVEGPVGAISLMRKTSVDLLFLDIQMPEIKGTDFAKMISEDTKIVFTTAYSEFALEGYELNALDYLLKPITFERFLKAINKAKTAGQTRTNEETITVKSGYNLHKLKFSDISYIVSDSEYVHYHTIDRKIMSNQSLKALERVLPSSLFIRVHRSYIVNRNWVTGLKGRDILLGDVQIPVSDSYLEKVKKELF
ncbi:LytR/AlgR family response regulator transcription factor [Eudoraea chungangensis]|uniref:LytR/AlgR family response regulator transcription factor n=1 Tax=Eudoraea chungangensis TaxID=1481905 RepID=UPI0023EB04F3|nr:LytTR family DNA-binding domain-containing protein [Eudoraea chungangensis]